MLLLNIFSLLCFIPSCVCFFLIKWHQYIPFIYDSHWCQGKCDGCLSLYGIVSVYCGCFLVVDICSDGMNTMQNTNIPAFFLSLLSLSLYQDILMLARIVLESHKNVCRCAKKILAYDIFYNQISVFLRQPSHNYINITENIININYLMTKLLNV